MAKQKEEKYIWNFECNIFPQIDPHSKIKHQIIEDYLKEYVRVLMKSPNIPELYLSLIDGFCGGGQYIDGLESNTIHLGSPLLILNAIREVEAELNIGRNKPRFVRTQNFFIDIKKENIDCLKAILQIYEQVHRIDKDIFLINQDFKSVLPKIIQKIQSIGKGNRALFLLDQYAYKDVPFDSIKNIFQSIKNAEVLLTFNVDSLVEYLSDNSVNKKAVANIGLEQHIDWDIIKQLKATNKHDWQYIIQQQLSKGILIESGAVFMTIFFVTPKSHNPRSYWFIHMANSFRANDVMKEIHWRYGNNFSHMLTPALFIGYDANKDIKITKQEDLLSGTEHHFDEITSGNIVSFLAEELPNQIYQKEELPFSDLVCKLTNFTMATEKKIKEALDYAINTKDIEVIDENKKAKRKKGSSIKYTDIIKVPSQRPLFFLPPNFEVKEKE